MKSLGIACLLLIIFVAGSTTPLISRAQSALPVKRQCGTQAANPQLNGFFWAVSEPQQVRSGIKLLTAGASKIEIKAPIIDRSTNTFAFGYQLSQDKRTMIFLTAINSPIMSYDFPKELVAWNVVTADGAWLTFPAVADWQQWYQLGPELKPGHFGVLSKGKDGVLMLLEAIWKD